MNKNDLRFIKTEDLIISTYEEMLRTNKKGTNVTQLCKAARINTSTFYTHYIDIEDLQTSLCRKRLEELLDKETAMEHLYDDPTGFVESLNRLFADHQETLRLLFAGKQDLMVDIVENRLLKIYADETKSKMSETVVRFCVGGAMRVLVASEGNGDIAEIVKIIRKLQ